MDAARYARIRELFLAAEELPRETHAGFLRSQAGDDPQLISEVLSLLAEHDAELARLEGERASVAPYPITPGSSIIPAAPPPAKAGSASSDHVLPKTGAALPAEQTDRGETAVGRRGVKPNPGKAPSTRRGASTGRGKATQHGAQDTHVSHRRALAKRQAHSKTLPPSVLWQQQARRNQRWNTGWLWLAAVLPTAIVGWWTYRNVAENTLSAIHHELAGVADSIALATAQFLDGRARLIESWSRQPEIQQAINELVALAHEPDAKEKLRSATQTDVIGDQLRKLSGRNDVKFVVWDRAGTILASWMESRSDVGSSIEPSGAANLAMVMRGETVLFGPARLGRNTEGFVPETDLPVMAVLVPVRSSDDQLVACLLVRGIEMFAEFDHMFQEAFDAGGLDAYAISRDGVMLTNSPPAIARAKRVSLELKPEDVAAGLRVSDPGFELASSNIGQIRRLAQPLTYAAADVSSGNDAVRVEPYHNYAGVPVVGAWRWNPNWNLGIVIEREAKFAFAPARYVRIGFILLGSLLSISALAAASQIAKQASRLHTAVHPLSRYEVVGELGRGGMGVVYRAKHRQLGRDTALKVLRGDRQSEEDLLRFDREAKLAASLSSPHTVMIYDYGVGDAGEAFCVMEFLRGITLYEVVARDGFQPFGRVLTILRQICDSLGEAHALGLLHRDVKPQNVMLSLDNTFGDWAVVFDFGLAKARDPEANAYQTAETVWAGTPMYMAPERYRNPTGMDPRSDLYSVGCVAYFLLSGRPPYLECDPESLFALVLSEQPINISTHRDEVVPSDINELVMKCMAKNADERFESIDALASTIDALREKHPWSVDEAQTWWSRHGGS